MSPQLQYEAKLRKPSEVVSLLIDGVEVLTANEPLVLFDALFEQRERFFDLSLSAMMTLKSPLLHRNVLSPLMEGHISLSACYLGREELAAIEHGRRVDHLISHFSGWESLVHRRLKPAFLLIEVPPMDKEGYFSMGPNAGGALAALEGGARALLQVNPQSPAVCSDQCRIHISQVEALCEVDVPMPIYQDPEPGEIDRQIAGHITARIEDGSVIQLGVGAVPSAVGRFLCNHRHLGIHTEVFTTVMAELMRCGAVDNSQKQVCPGRCVTGFVQGNRATYDFINGNPDLLVRPLGWVNDPMVISQNDRAVSINSCLSVDLLGQICAEGLGMSRFGGTGGQVDFVRGATLSRGGCSFIAMHSVVEKADGARISKIVLALEPGSTVTTLRTDVFCVATEYGVADLRQGTVRERARALIAIAHPDFREQLTFEAKQAGIIW